MVKKNQNKVFPCSFCFQIAFVATKLYLFFFLSIFTVCAYASNWRNIAPGIEYTDIGANLLTPWSHIHVFRVDLQVNQFDLLMADELARPYASISEFATHSKALIALNGGFFDKKFRPLGLRISNQKQENPLKRISWWGIFYIKNHKPYLTSLRQFRNDRQIDFALQSGPRLIAHGKIPSLKPGVAERSALGITKDNKVIILVTENSPLTTTNLAELMQSPPLRCVNALNLDGGSSSQLRADIDSFQLNVHNFSRISDAIVVHGINSRH